MLPLSGDRIRSSFVNASVRERAAIRLPDLDAIRWDRIEYLGWREPKQPELGWIVVELDDRPVGIQLRQAERAPRSRAQCSWCEDVRLPNDVLFFAAKRAGAAGRKGDTVGSLICAGFECSVNVRTPPPPAYLGFDIQAEVQRRIASLGERVRAFAENVARD